MGSVKHVQFVIKIWQNKSHWYKLLGVLRLLKPNVPKMVQYHVASVYWEIAALLVGSVEIEGVGFVPEGALCPGGWALSRRVRFVQEGGLCPGWCALPRRVRVAPGARFPHPSLLMFTVESSSLPLKHKTLTYRLQRAQSLAN